jgi:hypothetical protein
MRHPVTGSVEPVTEPVATFTGCSIAKVGTYKLQVTDGTDGTDELTALSATFTVTAGPATSLSVTTQPSGATGGSAFTTQPTVTLYDAGGNVATGSTATVTLAIGANPAGGTLTGCRATTVGGVASFSGCAIDKAGTGYTLVASESGLNSLPSSPFTVAVGAPARLVFIAQPTSAVAGQAFGPAPSVTVEDAGGNTVSTDAAPITLAIGTNPDAGTLSGCSAVSAAGVTTFTGCVLGTPASGYTLTANDGADGLSATSVPFAVIPVTSAPTGYREISRDGGVFTSGTATFDGSPAAAPLNKPVVGSATTPDGKGYWLVASDGGIFAFGDAAFYGSTGGLHLNQPIIGMAAHGAGGYWLFAADGGIFSFGNAPFLGSQGGSPLNAPIVGVSTS